MTTLGHSLTGLAALTLALPEGLSWRRRFWWAIFFITIASVPDWPLPGWGHRQLAVSHSLWVNVALCTALAVGLRKWVPGWVGESRILLSGAVAWMSHFLLDTLYGDLSGVAIYWPFSDGLASMPLPWLKILPHVPPPLDAAVIRVLLYELLTFGPLILLAYGWRRIWLWRRRG